MAHAPCDAKLDELNVLRDNWRSWNGLRRNITTRRRWVSFWHADIPTGRKRKTGVKIAMAAYAGLLSDGGGGAAGDHRFELDRMASMAQWASEQWPNTPQADEAWFRSIRAETVYGDPAKAFEYLNHIAPESSRRSDAELVCGQALWKAYHDLLRLPEPRQPPEAG